MVTASTIWREQRIRETFGRLPMLEGITFDEHLAITDVELATCPGREWSARVHKEVTLELVAILEDLEELGTAPALLRGRTFARALH